MRLHTFTRAPNPRRVRWLMAEKGIEDIELVEVDIGAAENRSPDYRGRFGSHHLPALELDDGTAITESLAICRYLEALYPEPNLFGRDPREQAVIEMWTRRCEIYLANPLMIGVQHSHPGLAALAGTQIPELAAFNTRTAESFLKMLERRLIDSPFVGGERFTVADIVAVCGIDFARLVRWRPSAEHAAVARWQDDCRARPAAEAGV